MGDKTTKAVSTGGLSEAASLLSPKIPTSGAFAAQQQQATALAEQKKKEQLRLAEAESEVAKKTVAASSKGRGRRSLIATSQTGLSPAIATTLGGS